MSLKTTQRKNNLKYVEHLKVLTSSRSYFGLRRETTVTHFLGPLASLGFQKLWKAREVSIESFKEGEPMGLILSFFEQNFY
jgi:hypothetical protein